VRANKCNRIVSGQDVLHRIETVSVNSSDKPVQQVVITSCGQLEIVLDDEEEQAARERIKKKQEDKEEEEEKVSYVSARSK